MRYYFSPAVDEVNTTKLKIHSVTLMGAFKIVASVEIEVSTLLDILKLKVHDKS